MDSKDPSGISTADIIDTKQADEAADVRRGGSTWRYLLVKAGGSLVSLLMVVLLGFFAFRILPGDPVSVLTRGRQVTAGQIAQIREDLGLNKPMLVQFWDYLTGLLHGDLGQSFVYRQPVSHLIGQFIGPTLLLMSVSMVVMVTAGIWVGQRAAWKHGSWFDRIATGTSLVGWSMPTFWFGLLLLLAFSGTGIFPSGGISTVGANLTGFAHVLDVARHMALPVFTLSFVSFASYTLIMRSSLLEELGEGYLTTARAKGLPMTR